MYCALLLTRLLMGHSENKNVIQSALSESKAKAALQETVNGSKA